MANVISGADLQQKKIDILRQKVRLLEGMVEDRTREAYLAQERKTALIAILQHCQAAEDERVLLAGCLDILLDRDFLRASKRGAAFMMDPSTGKLSLVAERNMDTGMRRRSLEASFAGCPCGLPVKGREIVFAADFQEPGWEEGRTSPHSHYCVPLLLDEQLHAMLLLTVPGHSAQDQEETFFFRAVADAIGEALLRQDYLAKLDQHRLRLEEMVAERTACLLQAEARFRGLFENAVEGIYQATISGRIIACNSSFARMLGFDSPEEVCGLISDIARQLYADPDDREPFLASLRSKGKASGFVARLIRRDGTLIWTESHARLSLPPEGGKPLIEGMLLDISRRKAAEDNLAAEKDRLAVTLASIGDGVMATDTSGRVTLLNSVAETLTGWRQEEALGRPIGEIYRLSSPEPGGRENLVEKVLASGRASVVAARTYLIARDGSKLAIDDSCAPIRNHEGTVVGAVLVFRDVTHKERQEAELQKIAKLESIGVLAGGIAHDFNNILTALMGNLALARRLTNEQGDPRRDLLDSANKAVERAKKLTGQLLTFAKGGEPVREAAAIEEIIRDSAGFILHGSPCTCVMELQGGLWPARIDRGQISQVIQNLVLNAAQAMPEGGAITIKCRNREIAAGSPLPLPAGRYLAITIDDQGPGIPAELLERIFFPYFSTKQAGSGLGLAIIHSIVMKHGGHIEVESAPGMGASFRVLLPACLEEESSEPEFEPDQESGTGRILVMDDEEMIRKSCGAILTHLGYEVEEAADGREALVRYQAACVAGVPFAAALMDLTIPGGMGGVETARELRRFDPGAVLLATSGYCQDPVMADSRTFGFDGAIAKPYRIEELAAILRRVLRSRR